MVRRNLLQSTRDSSCAAVALTSISSWPASLWVSLRAYWRFCRENPQQSGGNTCFVFFSKTTGVLAGGTGAIQRQQVMAGGGPLPQALRHLLAPARIQALNSRSTKSWQILKRQRPRSRLFLREESGWQTASCAWGREGEAAGKASGQAVPRAALILRCGPQQGQVWRMPLSQELQAQAGLPSRASFKPTLQSLHHRAQPQ